MSKLYYYTLTLRSLTDGRSFTKDIKTLKQLDPDIIKMLIEEKCNVELVAFKENTYYESTFLDTQKNIVYSGIFTYLGYEILVHKKILPLWKTEFDVINPDDLAELIDLLKEIYGNTFVLKSVRFD